MKLYQNATDMASASESPAFTKKWLLHKMDFMTTDELQSYIEEKREFDFYCGGKKFLITYGKDDENDGRQFIQLGQEFSVGQKFYSFREFLANAKVENYFLREYIQSL